MTNPCLTRQNAFLLEDNEVYTPLDLFCGICNESTDDKKTLFQPCGCTIQGRPYLAHYQCFEAWSIRNGCPTYCTTCKRKYKSTDSKEYRITITVLLTTFLLIPLLYTFVHIIHCIDLETFLKHEIQHNYGQDTFKNIPEQLILPTFSLQCFQSSLSTVPSFLISIPYCTAITLVSFIISFFFINAYF